VILYFCILFRTSITQSNVLPFFKSEDPWSGGGWFFLVCLGVWLGFCVVGLQGTFFFALGGDGELMESRIPLSAAFPIEVSPSDA